MYFDKSIKAHTYEGDEHVSDIFNKEQSEELGRLIVLYSRELFRYSENVHSRLSNQLYLHFDERHPENMITRIHKFTLKNLFLLIELLTKIWVETFNKNYPNRVITFRESLNNFFLFEKIPFQLIFVKKTEEFYMEKVIDEQHSEMVKQTLTNFDKYQTVKEDFKKAILLFSSGDYDQSVQKCCKTIEDYFCVILNKETCSSIDTYYKEVSKKLNIPNDIDERFKTIISFIHKYRSNPSHGSKNIHDPTDIFVINQLVIGYTMTILNYLHNIFEK